MQTSPGLNNALDPPLSRRELKQLMKRSNRPGLMHLFWWLLLLVCTASLVWLVGGIWWLLIPAMFLHGVVMVHHFALQHECSHYTAFRSRWLCRWLARYCGFLLVIPPLFFRYEHCDHHSYTNLPGRDPELIELPKSQWQYLRYLSALPYWRSQFGGMLRRATGELTAEEKRFIPASEKLRVVAESRIMIAGYLAIVAIMLAADWSAPVFYWWLPLLMAEPVMRFIRMTEHVGRPMVADMRINTRTSIVAAPWRFLAWNMNYHAEHHYAASVPFHALGVLHEKLRNIIYIEKHGYLNAHRDILAQVVRCKSPEPEITP